MSTTLSDPFACGALRLQPIRSAICAQSIPTAETLISPISPSGFLSTRNPAWISPPRAVASEMSNAAKPARTWAVAATSDKGMPPPVALPAESRKSRLIWSVNSRSKTGRREA
jgi:hypothetical protein